MGLHEDWLTAATEAAQRQIDKFVDWIANDPDVELGVVVRNDPGWWCDDKACPRTSAVGIHVFRTDTENEGQIDPETWDERTNAIYITAYEGHIDEDITAPLPLAKAIELRDKLSEAITILQERIDGSGS